MLDVSIRNILEGYEPKPGDEKRFVAKHVVAKTDDVAGNKDENFKGKKKSKTRKADQESPDDEAVYESVYRWSDIEEVMYEAGFNEDEILGIRQGVYDNALPINEDLYYSLIDAIIEEVLEEADDEDREAIEEMLSTESGFRMFLEMIDGDDDEG